MNLSTVFPKQQILIFLNNSINFLLFVGQNGPFSKNQKLPSLIAQIIQIVSKIAFKFKQTLITPIFTPSTLEPISQSFSVQIFSLSHKILIIGSDNGLNTIQLNKNIMKHFNNNNNTRSGFTLYPVQEDSHSLCDKCAKYEQDISILQQKLMQTHNKLIEQIDICRQQQIMIIKLNEKAYYMQNSNLSNVSNVSDKKGIGKIVKKIDDSYIQRLQPFLQHRNQGQNQSKNRDGFQGYKSKDKQSKQDIKRLQLKYENQISQLKQKMKRIQANRVSLLRENQKLIQEIQIFKTEASYRTQGSCNCGFVQKYDDLDKAFMKQRIVTNKLIQENQELKNQIQQIKFQKYHKREEVRTEPKRRKTPVKQKQKLKQDFQATKNLIRQMQQAEYQIRSKLY